MLFGFNGGLMYCFQVEEAVSSLNFDSFKSRGST